MIPFGSSSLESQVQPFNVVTPDNETLHAWHVLPLHLCDDYEQDAVANSPSGPAADVTQTKAFKHLSESPNARVVVNRMRFLPNVLRLFIKWIYRC